MTHHTTPSFRSYIGRAKGLGSAKEGVHHWWMQRVTSVALLVPMIYLLWQLPQMMTSDYEGFIGWINNSFNAIALLTFVLVGFYHAMLGVQVVIEDYVHGKASSVISLLLNKMFFFFLGIACVYAVAKLTFVAG